jgi:hypothetical protein
MQGAGKASCVELKEELSDVAWLEQTWEFQLETPVFHQRNGDFTIADPEILANHENMER